MPHRKWMFFEIHTAFCLGLQVLVLLSDPGENVLKDFLGVIFDGNADVLPELLEHNLAELV